MLILYKLGSGGDAPVPSNPSTYTPYGFDWLLCQRFKITEDDNAPD